MHVSAVQYPRVDWFPADVGASPLSFCPCWLSQQVWQCLTSARKKKTQIKCGNQMDNRHYHSLVGHYRYHWFKLKLNIKFHTHHAVCAASICPWLALMYSWNRLFIGQSIQETSQPPPAPPSLSVWGKQLQSFLQMDVWLDHRGHGEHKLSALAVGDANTVGRAQCGVKQKSAVRGDLWDNGAAFRK